MTAAATLPRYFSQRPEEVERRWRAYLQAIEPLQQEIVRLHCIFARPVIMVVHPGGEFTDLSPPWEESLPDEVRKHAENVYGHIRRTAAEYGFEVPDTAL